MSSCLSSRVCGFDLEHMVKWQPYSRATTTSNSSSPSSTLSESSNSPSTQKPRTPRKRPNQTYNEAVAMLSMASPNIFKIKDLTNIPKFTKHHAVNVFNDPPELIFLNPQIRIMKKHCSLTDLKITNSCQNTGEIESDCVSPDDFDTGSILNDEIEQGIDSIMGDCYCTPISESNDTVSSDFDTCYKYPMGLGFGVRNRVRALKNADDRNWWDFPMVDVSPAAIVKCERSPAGKKKKKTVELRMSESEFRRGLALKLDYDAVLNDWADKRLPLPEEIYHSSSPGGDIHAKAATIDLFCEDGGCEESSATRPMDKNHLKKIRSSSKKCLP